MKDVEQKLRIMLAAPQMLEALQKLLPHAREEWLALEAASGFTREPTATRNQADRWLMDVIRIEAAIKSSLPPQAEAEEQVEPCDCGRCVPQAHQLQLVPTGGAQ